MSKTVFKSVFHSEFQELITLKRSLGFKYQTEEKAFKRIDEYLCTTNLKEKTITKELCVKWCQKRSYESAANHCNRISSLRVFCKYLCGIGFSAYVPPKGITNHPPKYNAHIYTDDELKRFFGAVDKSRSVSGSCPYRSLVMPVFFRIIYTSGMRVSELRLVRIKDMNLDEGYILVRDGKNHKDRMIPIQPQLAEKCIKIKNEIHSISSDNEYFFMIRPGKEMTLGNVYHNFRRYLDKAGIPHTGKGPRVHDFRHTYCVNLLKKWTSENKDLYAYIPYMRTILGHESFEETAYYLKLTASLFPMIREKLDARYPDIIEEVSFNEKEYF